MSPGMTGGTVCAGAILIAVFWAGYVYGKRDEYTRLVGLGKRMHAERITLSTDPSTGGVTTTATATAASPAPLDPYIDLSTDRIVACMTAIGLRPLSLTRAGLIAEFHIKAPAAAAAFFNTIHPN